MVSEYVMYNDIVYFLTGFYIEIYSRFYIGILLRFRGHFRLGDAAEICAI